MKTEERKRKKLGSCNFSHAKITRYISWVYVGGSIWVWAHNVFGLHLKFHGWNIKEDSSSNSLNYSNYKEWSTEVEKKNFSRSSIFLLTSPTTCEIGDWGVVGFIFLVLHTQFLATLGLFSSQILWTGWVFFSLWKASRKVNKSDFFSYDQKFHLLDKQDIQECLIRLIETYIENRNQPRN